MWRRLRLSAGVLIDAEPMTQQGCAGAALQPALGPYGPFAQLLEQVARQLRASPVAVALQALDDILGQLVFPALAGKGAGHGVGAPSAFSPIGANRTCSCPLVPASS